MAFQERIDRLVDYVLTLQDSERCADFITAKGVGEALGIDDRAAGCVPSRVGGRPRRPSLATGGVQDLPAGHSHREEAGRCAASSEGRPWG